MKTQATAEIENILQHYQIGELVGFQRDERGYINTSYAIEIEIQGARKKYFLRRYKQGIKKEELLFEHSLIEHLIERGFDLVAKLIKTRSGDTYVHQRSGGEDEEGVFYAIFEFLLGDDKYTWVNPDFDDEELNSSATVLAQFHNAASDLIPKGRRSEPKIINLLPSISTNLARYAQGSRNTAFDAYLVEHLDLIQRSVSRVINALNEPVCQELVQLVIHCDYHPGNLKFRGGQVIGLFDFDWSKIDMRCFDVALGIFYFFTDWEGEKDGALRIDQANLFLTTYQDTLKDRPGVGPLSAAELKCLPPMINASNLYVLNWTFMDYVNKSVDPDEYLIYLKHSVNLIKWFEDEHNRVHLEREIASL